MSDFVIGVMLRVEDVTADEALAIRDRLREGCHATDPSEVDEYMLDVVDAIRAAAEVVVDRDVVVSGPWADMRSAKGPRRRPIGELAEVASG